MARSAPFPADVATAPTESESPVVRSAPRLQSLDAFRGLTIAAMLLVNNPGSPLHVYPPLEHAAWNGWTPTDLVFPFFLFIVGITTTLSLGGLLDGGVRSGILFRKVLIRAVLIFALGLLLQGSPAYELGTIRVPGVLQRIAMSYLAIVFDWVVITSPADGESLVLKTYLYEILYAPRLAPEGASLAYALTYLLLWPGLLTVLYRRRIFIRI